MNPSSSRMKWLLTMAVVAGGCRAAEQEAKIVPIPAITANAGTASAPNPTDSAGRGPDLADSRTDADALADFVPPFPERDELFQPPKRAQTTVRHDDEHGATVELKGFIHVDEPKVVLSIDGVISPVSQGGEKYGVQVIAIEPPSVVLQRGRSRWTATLE